MKFSFIPAGDEDTGSSRIRVYTLHLALMKDGKESCIGFSPDADVVIVQKKVTEEILSCIEKAKKEGKLIMYDFDDAGSALDYWVSEKLFREMIRLADVVTTDTPGHRDYIKGCAHNLIKIIPCSIDYYPVSPVRLSLKNEKKLRVLWFGSMSNIALFEKYATVLTSIPDVEVVVASRYSESGFTYFSETYPKVIFESWSLANFVSILQSCHLTCLMHDGSNIDREKNNNRMITSITWGVPAVVSRTPDYERTAIESGIEYAIFGNEADLKNIIERLRLPVTRDAYLDTSQYLIWNSYSPEMIKQKFLKIVESHWKNKQMNTHLSTMENTYQKS